MTLQQSAERDQSILLPDGRRLGYAEYGAPDGSPMLFFHGAPGSRHIHADMAAIAARCGARLIAAERPGYGLSDLQPVRSILDWPDNVTALVDVPGLLLGVRTVAIADRQVFQVVHEMSNYWCLHNS